ncbi:putative amidohydrolase YhaA [Cyphellophora attinorum]|uniref:Putative amidohydrolase YhaA n=1 Tax=Cyphellophora attinorum TaxID=1664694 RepID=A0A0N1H7C1_9EURO|nr:putative amidohydrolase YhaA [Phialophora attinorum]KPI38824.1 putative amidohydrolase YhaA [Phialophora attinorum]
MGDASLTSPYASFIDHFCPSMGPYEDLYKHLHQNPELSNQEKQTAATIESRLRKLSPDLEVKTNIGGYGIIAVLRNGPGTTILLRADFDALPVLEKTGLPYASKATQVDERDGWTKPVMHACGHDFHVTALLACCETLLASRDHWAGTVIFLFQPAEERGSGAQAMISDGLYDSKRHNCPIPDVVLGQHVFPVRQGSLCTKTGTAMSAADSLKITIHGRGGHGSMPHRTIDLLLSPPQSCFVSRRFIQAGDAENVIPFEAVIKCNTRTVTNRTREKVRKAIERIVKAECVAGGCEREPDFEVISSFPLTVNDADIVEKLSAGMEAHFGERYNKEMQFALGSEDFSLLASSVDRPYCFWFFGGIEGKEWDELAEKDKLDLVPTNHSPFFAPVLQPTLKTGVEALVVASLTYLGKEGSGVVKGKI